MLKQGGGEEAGPVVWFRRQIILRPLLHLSWAAPETDRGIHQAQNA